VSCHRVIDGGRDFKGNPNVVAGEGTGIVHSAPGCGDIDYQIGKQYGLVSIAPLGEDGRFLDGFGKFTGLVATAPETVDLLIDDLKQKELLVAVEKYPHIYPFCWRTGDELVFRLVDEWFINMDWRDEIMDVTRRIKWLPDSIQGQERELEWLTNMRDWMVSKKRYWGLALPIWVDEQTGDFEVIGSLAELKERAVEGWDEFAGHTPHKPWIDRVKIRHPKTGNLMSRVPDVGNPWLDAGIVPFSTMGFNTHPDLWRKWYPADLVTECFPGQFRNWFYSMLAMSTMMRHEEPDAEQKKPFKTLLGHRLVMNELGEPMSKSKGTAIWFEEAAEQLGVDTMRWMYLAQNPAQDLRFGTRHPEQRVTLETVNGPAETTIDGVPTCLVQSGPADEVRRLVLLPLWNSYAFFVNYARLDEFDPRLPQVPFAERPQIDRWILTNLEATIGKVRQAFEEFDTPAVCKALAHFIDDLSNWYIRRNRKRFWRSRKEVESLRSRVEGQKMPALSGPQLSTLNLQPSWDPDKLAAYQTLYRCLVTVSKLLAPATPFLAERMYRNLVCSWNGSAPPSVHLCEYPHADVQWASAALLEPMEVAQQIVRMGHRLRETIDQRVRQPLMEVRVASASPAVKAAVHDLADLIADELNVKRVVFVDSLSDIVTYRFRANPASLGKKHGKLLAKLRDQIAALPPEALSPLRDGKSVRLAIDGTDIELTAEDVSVSVENAEGWASAAEGAVEIALSTHLTPELLREGMARDFVRHVQQLRKDADLDIQQRIRIEFHTDDAEAVAAVREWTEFICNETLADNLTRTETVPESARAVSVGEARVQLQIQVA
jgi:isoleucyl-tRNA synthetase